MVRDIKIDSGVVNVTIALTVAGCPLRAEITRRVTDAVSPLDGVGHVAVDMTVMTPEELDAVRRKMGTTSNAHPHDHKEARNIPFAKVLTPVSLGCRLARVGWAKVRLP